MQEDAGEHQKVVSNHDDILVAAEQPADGLHLARDPAAQMNQSHNGQDEGEGLG